MGKVQPNNDSFRFRLVAVASEFGGRVKTIGIDLERIQRKIEQVVTLPKPMYLPYKYLLINSTNSD